MLARWLDGAVIRLTGESASRAATPYSAVMRLLPALSHVNQPVRYRTYTQTLCAVIKQANTTRGEVDRPFNTTCLAGEGTCAITTTVAEVVATGELLDDRNSQEQRIRLDDQILSDKKLLVLTFTCIKW